MVILKTSDYVKKCYDNGDGEAIFAKLKPLLISAKKTQDKIAVSFQGFDFVTSSFVNSAFVQLLNHFDLDDITNHITIIDSNKSINHAIRSIVTQAAEHNYKTSQTG